MITLWREEIVSEVNVVEQSNDLQGDNNNGFTAAAWFIPFTVIIIFRLTYLCYRIRPLVKRGPFPALVKWN